MGETVVYLDVLFMNNFIFDFLLLALTAKILKEAFNLRRILFSSLIGAIYAAAVFFPDFSVLSLWGFKIFVSMVMLLIAFRIRCATGFLRTGAVFYLVSFALYGGIGALYYFTPAAAFMDVISHNGVFYVDIPPITLMFFTLISAGIITFAGRMVYEKRKFSQFACEVFLTVEAREYKLQGFLDSGNQLKVPFSGGFAAVIGLEEAKKLLPGEAAQAAGRFLAGETQALGEFKSSLEAAGVRGGGVIPFESVGKKSGLLPYFIADRVKIIAGEREQSTENLAIAIGDAKFGRHAKYDVLLPFELQITENEGGDRGCRPAGKIS